MKNKSDISNDDLTNIINSFANSLNKNNVDLEEQEQHKTLQEIIDDNIYLDDKNKIEYSALYYKQNVHNILVENFFKQLSIKKDKNYYVKKMIISDLITGNLKIKIENLIVLIKGADSCKVDCSNFIIRQLCKFLMNNQNHQLKITYAQYWNSLKDEKEKERLVKWKDDSTLTFWSFPDINTQTDKINNFNINDIRDLIKIIYFVEIKFD